MQDEKGLKMNADDLQYARVKPQNDSISLFV